MEHYQYNGGFKDKVKDAKRRAGLKLDEAKQFMKRHEDVMVQAVLPATITVVGSVAAAVISSNSTKLETNRVYDPSAKAYVVPKKRLSAEQVDALAHRSPGMSVTAKLAEMGVKLK